jgi:hypothetical protein
LIKNGFKELYEHCKHLLKSKDVHSFHVNNENEDNKREMQRLKQMIDIKEKEQDDMKELMQSQF